MIVESQSTLVEWVHSLLRCISICDRLEQFTIVCTGTSDQHKYMRQSAQARDNENMFSSNSCRHTYRLLPINLIRWCLCLLELL